MFSLPYIVFLLLIKDFGLANLLTLLALKFYNLIRQTFFLWLSFNLRFPLILFYKDLCLVLIRNWTKIFFYETSFWPWIKTIYDFNRALNFSKNNEINITTIWSSSFLFKYYKLRWIFFYLNRVRNYFCNAKIQMKLLPINFYCLQKIFRESRYLDNIYPKNKINKNYSAEANDRTFLANDI